MYTLLTNLWFARTNLVWLSVLFLLCVYNFTLFFKKYIKTLFNGPLNVT
jgi:hypothetical protein